MIVVKEKGVVVGIESKIKRDKNEMKSKNNKKIDKDNLEDLF